MNPTHFHFSSIEQWFLAGGLAERLLLASALGAAIGFEREYHRRASGARTNMLVCLGCAFFTFLSAVLAGDNNPDKGRVAANIVQGIGFLGAGLILRDRNRVVGITSAATVFVVASIGMACGAGLYLPAVFAAAIVLIGLQVLRAVEIRMDIKHFPLLYEVRGRSAEDVTAKLLSVFDKEHRPLEVQSQSVLGDLVRMQFVVTGTQGFHDRMLGDLRQADGFDRVLVYNSPEDE